MSTELFFYSTLAVTEHELYRDYTAKHHRSDKHLSHFHSSYITSHFYFEDVG